MRARSGHIPTQPPAGRIAVWPLAGIPDHQEWPINVEPRLRIEAKEEGRALCLFLQVAFILSRDGSGAGAAAPRGSEQGRERASKGDSGKRAGNRKTAAFMEAVLHSRCGFPVWIPCGRRLSMNQGLDRRGLGGQM